METTLPPRSGRVEPAPEAGPAMVHRVPETAQQTKAADTDRGAAFFVWLSWGVMLLGVLTFVAKYARNVPLYDDWDGLVPVLNGDQPVTAAWLWSQHNEHRVPLPRLLLLALCGKLTGYDLRVAMFFNVLALAALAFALIVAARTVRGSASYTDAFLPISLLSLGQSANLLLSWQVQFVSSAILAGVLLCIILFRGKRLTLAAAVLAGVCLLLLPLCGANGLALVPALALWLGCVGVGRLFSSEYGGKRDGLVMLVLALAAVILVGLYFIGYERPSYHPPSPGIKATLSTSLQFLTMSFVPAAMGGELWRFPELLILAFLLLSVAALVKVWRNTPEERFRVLGLLLFLGGIISLALGLGWGRAGLGFGAVFSSRYMTLAVPGLCCVYFLCELTKAPALGRFVQMGLFTLVCILFAENVRDAIDLGSHTRQVREAFEQDLRAGVPLSVLAQRHSSHLFTADPSDTERLINQLRMLHRANIGMFGQMREDPELHEGVVPVKPVDANERER